MTAEIVIRIWKMIVFLVVSIALRVILAILPLDDDGSCICGWYL